ncbi:MAG: T9SS type A sorting domain-containing protein [Janthinobacterium lividum]
MPLHVYVPTGGTYALSTTNLLNFGTGAQVLLLEAETGARIDLAQQPSNTFQASTSALLGRFARYFKPAPVLAASPAALVQQVQVYPNPARSSFTLLLPAELSRTPVSVRVVNQLGQLVLERTLAPTAASAQFDASALAPGVYSLRLTSASGQVVKRVVVK